MLGMRGDARRGESRVTAPTGIINRERHEIRERGTREFPFAYLAYCAVQLWNGGLMGGRRRWRRVRRVAGLGPNVSKLFDKLLLALQEPIEAVFVEGGRAPAAVISCLRCILGHINEVGIEIALFAIL